MLDHSHALRKVYAEKLEEHPTPWHILVGFDEQTPGSRVNHENRRKNMCVMLNFLELGADILEIDATLFIPVVVRAKLWTRWMAAGATFSSSFFGTCYWGPRV